MPLPRRLARFNRAVTNRLMLPIARRIGGFVVLRHTGRKSGRTFETPLNAWRMGDQMVVALTYGRDVDWLKNAQAADSSELVSRNRVLGVGRPEEIPTSAGMEAMPALVRPLLTRLRVSDFVGFPVLK